MRLIALFLLLVACDVPAPALVHESRGPIDARLRARTLGNTVQLDLELDRHSALAADLHVDLELPPGTRLVSGTAHQRLVRNARARRDALSFVVEGRGREPLRVVLDARSTGFGYHQTLLYRFGAEAPLPVAPVPSGPPLRVGSRSFGRSIPAP